MSRNKVVVRVNNRGALDANGVKVMVSFIEWPVGNPAPPWDPASWISRRANGPPVIKAGKQGVFRRTLPFPYHARYLILVHVNCAEDLACTNPATGLPCAYGETPLTLLVAGDNNLGLRRYDY